MINTLFKQLRLALLKLAIRTVERAGLAVVQVKRTENAVYLVGAKGSYVRYDKVKA